jgi:hypothetical protein
MSPARLQTFIDTPICVLEHRVHYSAVHIPNVFCNGHPKIINCVYCNRQVNRDFWNGCVLHEGITYKSRVPRTSQMTSSLLRHTAAAMRALNVLCNSYNSRDKPLQLSSCTFCVVVYAYRLYFINVWHVYEWPKTYTWSGTFILKDGRYTFYFYLLLSKTWHAKTRFPQGEREVPLQPSEAVYRK